MELAPLRLKKNEDRRLRAGHLWVFSNEVDTGHTPLAAFEPGEPVEIQDSRGAPLGTVALCRVAAGAAAAVEVFRKSRRAMPSHRRSDKCMAFSG